ncbi:MAG: hypothetical protein ACUVWZ_10130 [Anaerolineae bacterium]
MRPGRWTAIVLLAMALGLAAGNGALAQETGILEGRVVNGTAGGPEIGAGLPVVVHVRQEGVEVESLETTTDADGRFRLSGLDRSAGTEYWPEVLYQDVSFFSPDPYQFGDGQSTLTVQVTVYETTEDDSAVRIDSAHWIVEAFDSMLRITEVYLVGNSGDRAYVGRDGQTVAISLPSGAVGLAFEEGTPSDRFRQVEGGVVDTWPITPGSGTTWIVFSYHLPVEPIIPLQRSFAYPVTLLEVMVPRPGWTLRSDQLRAQGSIALQGKEFEVYEVQQLAVNAPVRMELVREAEAIAEPAMAGGQGGEGGSVGGTQRFLRWMGIVLAGLAVAAALAYPSLVRPAAPAALTSPQARRLLGDLAALEDAWEAGEIDRETYERQRAELYRTIQRQAAR